MRVVIIFAAAAAATTPTPFWVKTLRSPHDFELLQRSSLRHCEGGREPEGGREGWDVCLLRKGNRTDGSAIQSYLCKQGLSRRVPIKSICPSARDARLQEGKHAIAIAIPAAAAAASVNIVTAARCGDGLCPCCPSRPSVSHLKHVRNL